MENSDKKNVNPMEENKFEFQDIVRYKGNNETYKGCEGMVLEQKFHNCYQDYETKVAIKLQGGYQEEVWLWGSNLEKIQNQENS